MCNCRRSWGKLLQTYSLDGSVRFIIPVADGEPNQATPLQGFSMSLCYNSHLIRAAAFLPSSIYDLTPEGIRTFAARRVCGVNPINWLPMSPRAIRAVPLPAFLPFNVLLLGDTHAAADYRNWARSCEIAPLIVAAKNGDITIAELTLEALQAYCLQVCNLLPPSIDPEHARGAREAIEAWEQPPLRSIEYNVKGHATVVPNLMVLSAFGFADMVHGRFDDIGQGIDPYVEQVASTTQSIFTERAKTDAGGAADTYPRFPDLNLFAPAMFSYVATMKPPNDVVGKEKHRFLTVRNSLVRQAGYNYTAKTPHQIEALFGATPEDLKAGRAKPSPHHLSRLRQLELSLATEAIGAFAASDLSATIRLPHAVNTTSGAVRQFATHYRSDENRSRKRVRAFKEIQASISSAVPAAYLPFVRTSRDGVRIVADAHLEWLDVDGLPLCIRKNVSRIPVTPGNLLIDQLAPLPLIRLTPESFRRILVISALKRDDPIRPMFELAFEIFGKHWQEAMQIDFVEVSNADELAAALNGFDGPLVIFDGHGSHPKDGVGVLHLKDETFDVWQLRERVSEPPPIVILSACDTHAADRNHATVANGFLALGCRSVLSSVFPLDAHAAASFAARLVFRISDFIPAAVNAFDRALSWTEIVSGMLRMQLLTDFLRLLEREKVINEETYFEVHKRGNIAINGASSRPFEDVLELLEKKGSEPRALKTYLDTAIASSSALAYLNVGRPETILLDTIERIARDDDEDQQPA
ncbi:CHAT domain-containing protein [Rhizobium leguminosarum bv. viciae]|nr:CHAT domain-containing protein [Rhizobium leguminosarum bv. viciae]